jgi:hypothetical protein
MDIDRAPRRTPRRVQAVQRLLHARPAGYKNFEFSHGSHEQLCLAYGDVRFIMINPATKIMHLFAINSCIGSRTAPLSFPLGWQFSMHSIVLSLCHLVPSHCHCNFHYHCTCHCYVYCISLQCIAGVRFKHQRDRKHYALFTACLSRPSSAVTPHPPRPALRTRAHQGWCTEPEARGGADPRIARLREASKSTRLLASPTRAPVTADRVASLAWLPPPPTATWVGADHLPAAACATCATLPPPRRPPRRPADRFRPSGCLDWQRRLEMEGVLH